MIVNTAKWLEEFTEQVIKIKSVYEYTQITTAVLDKLVECEQEYNNAETEMIVIKALTLQENDKLSSEKLELTCMTNEKYLAARKKMKQADIEIALLKRALDVLRSFKDIYIAELKN